MEYLVIQEEKPIKMTSKKDVIKVNLYIKMLKNGFSPFDNDLDILAELFEFGGYNNKEEQIKFFNILLNKKLRNSIDSIRNKMSEFTTNKILIREKKNSIKFNPEYLANKRGDVVGLSIKLTHAI